MSATEGRSLSFEVPNIEEAEEEVPPGTYLRLGTFDHSSPVEQAFFRGTDPSGAPPGVLLVSPGKIVQYAASLDSVVTARESTRVVQGEDGTLISAVWSHEDKTGGVDREVAYKRSLASEFEMSEKEAYEFGQSMAMKVANAMEVKAATGFEATLGAKAEMAMGLGVDLSTEGIEATMTGVGKYSTEGHRILEGTEKVFLRYNPAGETVRVLLTRLSITLQAVVGIASGLVGLTALLSFPASFARPAHKQGAPELPEDAGPGAVSAAVALDQVKTQLEGLRTHQAAVTGLLAIAEAAGLALGIAALALRSTPDPVLKLAQLSLDVSGAKLAAGLGKIDLSVLLGELTIAFAPLASIRLSEEAIILSYGASSITLSAEGVSIEGAQVTANGAEIELGAPVVRASAV